MECDDGRRAGFMEGAKEALSMVAGCESLAGEPLNPRDLEVL